MNGSKLHLAPRLSVVMAVYNGQRYVAETIQSVLDQTYADFEFIVVDDGSIDSTAVILEHFRVLDQRIKIIQQPKNFGVVAALNLGCSFARGQFIARIDADDINLPERFSRQIQTFDQRPELVLLGSQALFIDENGNPVTGYEVQTGAANLRWSMIFHNVLINSSVMMRRDIAEQVGFYAAGYDSAEDYELWSKISRKHWIDNLPETLVKYRVWSSSLSFTKHDEQQKLLSTISRAMMTYYLSDEVSEVVNCALRRLENPFLEYDVNEYDHVAIALENLHKLYGRHQNLTPEDEKLISGNVDLMFYRLIKLAIRRSYFGAFRIALNRLLRHPKSMTSTLTGTIRRILDDRLHPSKRAS